MLQKFKQSVWLEIVALAAISIFTYFVHLGGLSHYRDDWYYMYDGLVGGGQVFVEMFRHLRPARGPLFEFLFGLFGTNPQPYLFLLSFWRLAGGWGALWLFRLLWPGQRRATFFMAALFLVYPGFLWWVQGFEYQPMVLSVGLQIFSIAFTLKALQTPSRWAWAGWMGAAVLTGWLYLAFVEYAIGMEGLRWLCVYLLHHRTPQNWMQKIIAAMRSAAVALAIPLGFLVWRQFIFDNQRKAADLELQAGAVFGSLSGAAWAAIRFVESVLNVSILAWTKPFGKFAFSLRLRDLGFAAAWMLIVLGISLWVHRLTWEKGEDAQPHTWTVEAMWVGLLSILGGVLPIVVANRIVEFDRFSHYALPASVGAAMFVVGLVSLLDGERIRLAVLSTLLGLSVLTHASLAAQARSEEELVREFWHQAAWRIPSLKAGTVILANYAGLDYGEGSDIVWGPANFIYHTERQAQIPIRVPVAAARLEADAAMNILTGAQFDQNYIVVNEFEYDFDNLLVMSLPSPDACVHVLDGAVAEVSTADPPLFALAASKSRLENVALDADFQTLPVDVFGGEPTRDWCFYYQKAQLARQQTQWDEVLALGRAAAEAGLHPNDQIEWMPFLQAAAATGDAKQVRQISTRINTEKFYRQQACLNLRAMTLPPDMRSLADELFCGR